MIELKQSNERTIERTNNRTNEHQCILTIMDVLDIEKEKKGSFEIRINIKFTRKTQLISIFKYVYF